MSGQFTFEFPQPPSWDAADFVVGAANAQAVAWIERWPDWPGAGLVLVGPQGAGKTHLAEVWRRKSGAVVLPADATWGMLGTARYAVIEDVSGGGEALLHVHNLVAERRGHVLLTARTLPQEWAIALPDLRSRMRALAVARLLAPDDGLLAAVMVKLFTDRQLRVTPEVIAYLTKRLDRSFAAIGAAVDRLDRAALAEQRTVTTQFARGVLGFADGDT